MTPTAPLADYVLPAAGWLEKPERPTAGRWISSGLVHLGASLDYRLVRLQHVVDYKRIADSDAEISKLARLHGCCLFWLMRRPFTGERLQAVVACSSSTGRLGRRGETTALERSRLLFCHREERHARRPARSACTRGTLSASFWSACAWVVRARALCLPLSHLHMVPTRRRSAAAARRGCGFSARQPSRGASTKMFHLKQNLTNVKTGCILFCQEVSNHGEH